MTYTVQYYNDGAAEWRWAGYSSPHRKPMEDRMRDARILCGDTLRFRIVAT